MIDADLLEITPSIHPELKEHTNHFEKHIYKVNGALSCVNNLNLLRGL
ncbi:MAG: hypothetical protein H8E81_05475 [Deltaproteobacteria bacterium]|nr:hypothetical protein [Deltaproteobacteria bacterium]